MSIPSPYFGGSPLSPQPLVLGGGAMPGLMLPPAASSSEPRVPAVNPGIRYWGSPVSSPVPHPSLHTPISPAASLVTGLAARVDILVPHLHIMLRASAVAVLLFGPDEERAAGWFRQAPMTANSKNKAGWEAVLDPSTQAYLGRLEQDDDLAVGLIETGLRSLLDTYLMGSALPSPAVLYVSWRDDGTSPPTAGGAQKPPPRAPLRSCESEACGSACGLSIHCAPAAAAARGRPGRTIAPSPDPPVPPLRSLAPWHGPPARVRPLPAPIACAVGDLEAAVNAAAKDMRELMSAREGVQLSPGADFGVWPWGSIQRTLYRQVFICNTAHQALWLLDVRVLQPNVQGFHLDDDHGLVAQGAQRQGSLGPVPGEADSDRSGKALSSDKRIYLKEGESYCVTVKLTAEELGEGMIAAAIIFTLAWNEEDDTESPDIFCAGLRACVTVVPSKVIMKLRPEAPPFVPQWQQAFFDSPAELYILRLEQVHSLLSASNQAGNTLVSWDDLPQYVSAQQAAGSWGQQATGFTFWRHVESELQSKFAPQEAQSSDAGEVERFPSLIRLARALEVEELTMETDIRKYDLFGVRPALGFRNHGDRHYEMVCASSNVFTNRSSGVWAGLAPASLSYSDRVSNRTRFLVIEVKGLPEGRPSLECGDTVFLRTCDSSPSREFACMVLAVESTRVSLLPPDAWWQMLPLHDEATLSPDIFPPVHIRLSFDRVLLRRMGMALLRAAGSSLGLPPPHPPGETLMDTNTRSFVWPERAAADGDTADDHDAQAFERLNPCINDEQWRAVVSVLSGHGRPQPYILYGPAGTGKTLTLTELILQVLKARRREEEAGSEDNSGRAHLPVLACAATAFAADILCAALAAAGVGKGEMIRLNDIRRSAATARQGVLPFCMTKTQKVKSKGKSGGAPPPSFCIDMPALWGASVVVASCASAAVLEPLVALGGGFDFIIIDEAAQALIPESLIPLSLASKNATVVLSGDPRQLGPNVRCRYSAASRVLQNSLQLEWLLCSGPNAATVCMLRRNYRSSAALLELPSRMFYNDALLAEADEAQTRPPEWEELAGEDDGSVGGGGKREMLFYGVMGQQLAVDPMVPSWCNPLEALRCVELVKGMLHSVTSKAAGMGGGKALLLQEDVGVIAPFRKQAYELRRLLRAADLGGVRCGTVDDFQGQEARVIFISTTLTRVASLRQEECGKARAGVAGTLLSDVQRFCVAITRAQALLVVVGHPVLLLEAGTWRSLIMHCAARGAYKGAGAESFSTRLGLRSAASTADESESEVEVLGDSRQDLEGAVEKICQMAVLGSGHVDMLYPDLESAETLAAAYSEEIPWRVAL